MSEQLFGARRLSTFAAALLATAAWPALAQDVAPADAPVAEDDTSQDIIVTGFRGALQNQATAKREATGFTDSIFAEDIGKFPDTNIAESVNRIPGITIQREVTGEGTNVAIRGLGTNFTRVLLNGAPVAVASVRFDAQSTNREVDLDLLPTELFTQLTVSKSPTAGQLEGGAAGTVNLRSARPFDNPGFNVSYGLQGSKISTADDWGYRGYALASATFGDFGILVGGALVRNKFRVDGYETIGFTNPNLSRPAISPGATAPTPEQIFAAQCRAGSCNGTGGGNFSIPGTVPSNAGNGLTPGAIINEDFLLANNPGASLAQIDNGLLPRLGRPRTEVGDRNRENLIASIEWRPSDALHFYVDGLYGHRTNEFERTSMNWVVRNGAPIPLNTTYDREDCTAGCVVTGGTYANAQFFLEYRPYNDVVDFYGINPGLDFVVNDWIKGDFQLNYTKSNFRRESPTVLVITEPNTGVTVEFDNSAGGVPVIGSNIDLNDPENFGWFGGSRVNLNGEERETETKGVRGSLTFGDEQRFSARIGAAYDKTSRRITPFDNTNPWQNAICGNGPSVTLPGPNTATTPCTGLDAPGSTPPAGFPTFPGYGTEFTEGGAPITYAGSLIPNSAIASYLRPGSNGFITVDWSRFAADTNYDGLLDEAGETGTGSSGANGGLIDENVLGAFVELNGIIDLGPNRLRLNGGVRYVRTEQTVGGRVSVPDGRNAAIPNGRPALEDGARYPNTINFVTTETKYENWLPSLNIAFELGDNAVFRGSLSRTMTRPDPNALLPGASFVQPSADIGTIGNGELDPFISSNIDLGFEYYTGGEGLISVAAFRKSLVGFTIPGEIDVPFSFLAQYGITLESLTQAQRDALTSRAGTGSLNDVEISLQQQVNSDGKVIINGLEFQVVQPLDFLTERFGVSGLGFIGNLTIIDQKSEGSGPPAVAVGVAPMTYTLTGYYEKGGISARLAYTFNEGSQNSQAGQNGINSPGGALFGRNFSQLDFSGSVDLGEIFDNEMLPSLVLNVINITKEPLGSYFQFPNATFNEFQPGRTILLGVRGSF